MEMLLWKLQNGRKEEFKSKRNSLFGGWLPVGIHRDYCNRSIYVCPWASRRKDSELFGDIEESFMKEMPLRLSLEAWLRVVHGEWSWKVT